MSYAYSLYSVKSDRRDDVTNELEDRKKSGETTVLVKSLFLKMFSPYTTLSYLTPCMLLFDTFTFIHFSLNSVCLLGQGGLL